MHLRILLTIGFLVIVSSCRTGVYAPTEVPTIPPLPSATPLAKLALKPDVELERQIAEIAKEAKGKVGVAAVLLETGDAAFLNADQQFPMQSVYKLPIAMAVMDQVRLGKLDLDEKVGVTKDDFVRAGMRSPLRDENPTGREFTVRELIRLSLVESDGTASDVLLRLVPPTDVQSHLTQIGIHDMKVVNTEKEIGKDWETQYRNWSTPMASAELLRWLCRAASEWGSGYGCNAVVPVDEPTSNAEKMGGFLHTMAVSNSGAKRLKAQLPNGTVVAHKTGTGGTLNGITAATNDVGIIFLPGGKHLAIAVFVSDSPADEKTREAVIARISKAVWDRWHGSNR